MSGYPGQAFQHQNQHQNNQVFQAVPIYNGAPQQQQQQGGYNNGGMGAAQNPQYPQAQFAPQPYPAQPHGANQMYSQHHGGGGGYPAQGMQGQRVYVVQQHGYDQRRYDQQNRDGQALGCLALLACCCCCCLPGPEDMM